MNTVDRVFTTIAQIWGVILTLLLIVVIVVYVRYSDEIAKSLAMLGPVWTTVGEGFERWEKERGFRV